MRMTKVCVYAMRLQKIELLVVQLLLISLLFASSAGQNCITPYNQYGFCTKISLCTQIGHNFLLFNSQSNNQQSFSDYVSTSLCGFDGFDFLVCCQNPGEINSINSINTVNQVTPAQPGRQIFQFGSLSGSTVNAGSSGFPAVITQLTPGMSINPTTPFGIGTSIGLGTPISGQYYLFRENVCGLSRTSTNRVVGGMEAQRGAYPWIAALGYSNQINGQPRFLCGGSLITQRHVLSSAHCVTNDLYMARLGAHNVNQNNQPGARDVQIERKILHPSFDSRTISNDISILKLIQDVPITNTIRPICLPVSEPIRSMDYTGYNPFIAGWGAVTFQGPASTVLRDAQVPVVNLRACEASYRTRFPSVALGNDIICAGDGFRDACQGDSGGPLMLPELSPDRTRFNFYLIGVVSYGYECARPNFPGIYSRVSSYIPWIESQLNI